jgi:hypothetical protein
MNTKGRSDIDFQPEALGILIVALVLFAAAIAIKVL